MHLLDEFGALNVVFLAVLALTIMILLRRTRRYLARQKNQDSALVHTARPQDQPRRPQADAPDEVLGWEVRMHETARDLAAQLDSKMGALQALIADADRAAARLEAAVAKPGASARKPGRPDPPAANQAQALKSPRAEKPAAAELSPGDGHQRPSARQCREEIHTLADYGFSAAEIAGRVDCPVGEVELILSLREKR
jgi:hypothetical protein